MRKDDIDHAVKAPPPTRGWTRNGQDRPRTPIRLPRLRGDGPADRHSPTADAPGLPRLRGDGPGAPVPVPTGHRRLPRLRGDGPVLVPSAPTPSPAPPPTRGWTQANVRSLQALLAPPPTRGWTLPTSDPYSWIRRRLPRLRGDGPHIGISASQHRSGSPAYAGMDPRRPCAAIPDTGSPAYAGMDPSATPMQMAFSRLPRLRGDGPSNGLARLSLKLAPPPTRGWTQFQA